MLSPLFLLLSSSFNIRTFPTTSPAFFFLLCSPASPPVFFGDFLASLTNIQSNSSAAKMEWRACKATFSENGKDASGATRLTKFKSPSGWILRCVTRDFSGHLSFVHVFSGTAKQGWISAQATRTRWSHESINSSVLHFKNRASRHRLLKSPAKINTLLLTSKTSIRIIIGFLEDLFEVKITINPFFDNRATNKINHGKIENLVVTQDKWFNYGKFHLLFEKWDVINHSRPSSIKGFRGWLSIKNLPLDLWRRAIFEVIGAHFGGLESFAPDTLNLIRCTDARIQVWAYESIPTIIGCGVDKVNDDAIPRMLRWVCQQSPKFQTISQVFDSPMLIIKAFIKMTPEEEQLKIASGELFENLRSSTIVQPKNGGSKKGRKVVNDEDDFKKSKKQKSKTKMKKAIRNLQDRVAVVEGQLTSIKSDIDELKGMMSTILKHSGLQRKGDEGDCKGFEGLVDHTVESEEVDNAKTEDVDTGGTPNWLRMPKEDEISNGAKHIELKKKGDEDVHTVGTPPWLRFNIELEKPINVLEKKVEIGLEEPIDVVDDEVEIEDSGKKLRTHFDSDNTEIEPFPTQRPHVRLARRKRANVYLSIPFTTLPKRSMTSTTTTSQCEPIVYHPMHKILDVDLDRLRAWITDKRTDDEHLDALFLFIRLKIKAVGIPSAQNFTTADTIFMRILVAKWLLYKECIKDNHSFNWEEEYRLVDYVVGSKEDFQDHWTSVDYAYSPFNVHANHWVLLCLDLVSCQVKVWNSFPSLTTAEEMTNILLPIRKLVPKLLDSSGFFDRRGRSSTYKEPWPVVIVDSIPLQRNNSDCGVFTIKYFEYIAAGVDFDTLFRQPRSVPVIRHSINLEQKIPQSNERPFCNVAFDLRIGQGLYVNRSEWRLTPIAIASEAMHHAGI
ncbi:Ulp1-like peptidase [Cucumis melo var. makuwa]|uniref:Ulp1-like peptidase n=1 Tax=Cucumis melo var. makuwa TaxID=1194695 RepID=A0A5A7T996_CUCMM|nr:Ulp1-like peptidase [Cucumis melo var. makuwa]